MVTAVTVTIFINRESFIKHANTYLKSSKTP